MNKLHRQFAQPPVKKLKSLLHDAKLWNGDYLNLLEDIERKSDLWKRYTKHQMACNQYTYGYQVTRFNEKIAMDLQQWKRHCILHMIDMW